MADFIHSSVSLVIGIVPALTTVVAIVAVIVMFLFAGSARIQFGSFRLDYAKPEQVKERILNDIRAGTSPQNALMQEYHAQGLSQSRISFWFSLVFASLGFAIIASSIIVFLQGNVNPTSGWLESAGKPIFTLVAGTIIDAVSALFFVQSNRARQLMTEFFDKLRIDRKLDESLGLLKEIDDPLIASRIRGVIALSFSDVSFDKLPIDDLLKVDTVKGNPSSVLKQE